MTTAQLQPIKFTIQQENGTDNVKLKHKEKAANIIYIIIDIFESTRKCNIKFKGQEFTNHGQEQKEPKTSSLDKTSKEAKQPNC